MGVGLDISGESLVSPVITGNRLAAHLAFLARLAVAIYNAAVIRMTRIFAVALVAILLAAQSAAFAYFQLSVASPENMAVVHSFSGSESGRKTDSCAHCPHGGHHQNHFVGHILQPSSGLVLSLNSEQTPRPASLRIPNASPEPPYRPPRQYLPV